MIQFSSLTKARIYHHYFTHVRWQIMAAPSAAHSNLNRTSLFSISKYRKITGKMVHSNHFFKAHSRSHPSPMGGIDPDLNGYLTSTIVSAPPVGVEFESNCSRTTVNRAKMRPPQTLSIFEFEGTERSLRSIYLHFLQGTA